MKDGKEKTRSDEISPMGIQGRGGDAHGSREYDGPDHRAVFRMSVVAQCRAGLLALLEQHMAAGGAIGEIAEQLGWRPSGLFAVIDGPDTPSLGEVAELAWALGGRATVKIGERFEKNAKP